METIKGFLRNRAVQAAIVALISAIAEWAIGIVEAASKVA